MSFDHEAIETLIAKERIRELALLYSRGVDRKDPKLLRSLYTDDATDTHGEAFDGSAKDFVDFLERSFPYIRYSGHHICNHLISVDGDTGEGEVYALAYHVIPDGKGGWVEDLMAVRYIDRYRRESGQWRFAKRVVTFDMRTVRPYSPQGEMPDVLGDPSYTELASRLFSRNPRG
jgi:hypothetical protein